MPKVLIDCDAFFASCEQARNPSLKEKAVLVSGPTGTRSVVSSASYPAKTSGVKAGMSPYEASKLCKEAIFTSGDFAYYVSVNRMLELQLRSMGLHVETSSIDEFFVDIDATFEKAVHLMSDFAGWTSLNLGITVSIGIAPTRILAKLASEIVKPCGITTLRPEDLPGSILGYEANRLLGIGKATALHLSSQGIVTLGQLMRAPDEVLAQYGYDQSSIKALLSGNAEACDPVDDEPPKSISSRMTLNYDTLSDETMHHCMSLLCDHVCCRMGKEGLCAKVITVTARYDDFETHTLTKSIREPIACGYQAAEHAIPMWKKHYIKGRKLRLMGLALSGLSSKTGLMQLPLLSKDKALVDLEEVAMSLRRRFGDQALKTASYLALKAERQI